MKTSVHGRGARSGGRVVVAALLAIPCLLSAQKPSTLDPRRSTPGSFDRRQIPKAGPTPSLHVPAWTTERLSNGAQLIVSQKHDLPLVSFNITFLGGANQFEPAAKTGLAGMAASMMSEGTKTRTGDELSNALQLLGTSVSVSVGGESGGIGFLSTKQRLEPVLAILEDMLVNPSFPPDALERLRAQSLVALTQARDRTEAIAGDVFPKVLYGDAHPYGRVVDSASVKAITRDDIVAFHREYFRPGRAIITVVGDVEPAAVRATIERTLAPWSQAMAGGSVPSFAYPAVPTPKATTIFLVDKPGAAQSTFALGLAGPPRDTPDFFALQVMNTILGGQFQSRLNADIREEKGYSYGVSSGFSYGKGPGPFEAGGDVVTAKSDSALIEFVKQLRGIRGERPVTDEELQTAKDNLIQRLPRQFASVSSTAGAIGNIYVNGLPTDYYQRYASNVERIGKADVERVARKYIDLDHLAIVIVGDRKEIEAPLRKTGVAPIVVLDADGKVAK